MKTITIRLPDVEAVMLVEIKRHNKSYQSLLDQLITETRST